MENIQNYMTKFRGFIAIDISPSQKILDFSNELKNSKADIKTVEIENIHITLKFLGDTESEAVEKIEGIMKECVKDIDPFEIKLFGTGVFPDKNYIRIIWIGIEDNGELSRISDRLNERLLELGFEKEKREFSPHLTVARVKSSKNKDNLLKIVEKYRYTDFETFRVESLKLKKSELTSKGPIYTTLKEVKL